MSVWFHARDFLVTAGLSRIIVPRTSGWPSPRIAQRPSRALLERLGLGHRELSHPFERYREQRLTDVGGDRVLADRAALDPTGPVGTA